MWLLNKKRYCTNCEFFSDNFGDGRYSFSFSGECLADHTGCNEKFNCKYFKLSPKEYQKKIDKLKEQYTLQKGKNGK